MARSALEQASPAEWIDGVFDAHRRYQDARELLFSTIIELMTLVAPGLRPSLHAAARQSERIAPSRGHRGAALPVQALALYDPDCGLLCDAN